MAIYRLTGGITPPSGVDPRTFPGIWNNMAPQFEVAQAQLEEVTTALDNLVLDNANDVDINLPTLGDAIRYDGANWVNSKSTGFNSVLIFTASTVWENPLQSMASPIVRITIAGGGGGGGGGQGDGSTIGGTGGNGGTSRVQSDGFAYSLSMPGGVGGNGAGTILAQDATYFYNAGNNGYGGQCNNSANARSAGNDGSGGNLRTYYQNLSLATYLDIEIGGGGTAGAAGSNAAPGSVGQSGWVMIEYVGFI